ncbi:MAG: carbohydrate kinase family protein [Patescibacteria group bacterium]
MFSVITIGDALLDTHVQIDDATVECGFADQGCKLCLDYAGKVPITGSFQSLGGNAANVAAGAAKLGLTSAILTSLGQDTNGKIVEAELVKNKIDTSLVSYDKETATRYSVVLNFKGERTILSLHQKRNYPWPKKMPAVSWIYYTSLSEGFEPLQDELLKFLAQHPTVRLAVNPGSFQLKSALEKIKEILPKTDLLIVNLEEAEKIAGFTLAKAKGVPAIIHKILTLGVKEVAITDAARGAWCGNEEEVWQMEAYPVKVISKTGAGDAFASGYMAAKQYDHDLHEALRWGIANSCGIIGHFGAQVGLLDKEGLQKMIKAFPKVEPQKIT